MNHHTEAYECPLCEEKLARAHPDLRSWYYAIVKPAYLNAHIAWSYRDQASQEQAFMDGKSLAHYPNSPHNRCDEEGNPCSDALDLFQIDENGQALFSPIFYRAINSLNGVKKLPILWGGNFRRIHDEDHFQRQTPQSIT